MLNTAPVSETAPSVSVPKLSTMWSNSLSIMFRARNGLIGVVSTHFQDDQVHLIHLGRARVCCRPSFHLQNALSLSAPFTYVENRKSFHCQVAHISRQHNRSIPLGQPLPDNNDAGRILSLVNCCVVLLFSSGFSAFYSGSQIPDGALVCVANANEIDLKLSTSNGDRHRRKSHSAHPTLYIVALMSAKLQKNFIKT